MAKVALWLASLLILALAAGLLIAFLFRHPTPDPYQQAQADLPPRLPGDDGAHFAAQTEWWYYTGELLGEGGEHFGFEVVFFKAYPPSHAKMFGRIPVSWLCNPAYSSHLAVTDLKEGTFTFAEQVNCPLPWAGGARTDRYEVWNRGWWAGEEGSRHHLHAGSSVAALDLTLVSMKPATFHGSQGVVPMGAGGTSYYYSHTRMGGSGWLEVGGRRILVQARAWMDHQWGSWDWTGFQGWDWFSLRLDSGEDLMVFQFRDQEGMVQPQSFGTYVGADGATVHLPQQAFVVEVLDRWTSPRTGATYPVAWRIATRLPTGELVVRAELSDQELPLRMGPTYWEGICQVEGTLAGEPVRGHAYVEMTGYR